MVEKGANNQSYEAGRANTIDLICRIFVKKHEIVNRLLCSNAAKTGKLCFV